VETFIERNITQVWCVSAKTVSAPGSKFRVEGENTKIGGGKQKQIVENWGVQLRKISQCPTPKPYTTPSPFNTVLLNSL